MKIEGLTVYLENLVPGVAMLGALLALIPQQQMSAILTALAVLKSDIFLLAVFLSVAYMMGLISAVISRMLVNSIASEKLTRPLMLSIFNEIPYTNLRTALSLPEEKDFRKRWNQLYRAALAYQLTEGGPEIKAEILRRRELARLVRNLFFPLTIGAAAVTQLLGAGSGWFIVPLVGLASILLYSYGEYTIFSEAVLPFARSAKPNTKAAQK